MSAEKKARIAVLCLVLVWALFMTWIYLTRDPSVLPRWPG